MLSFTPNFNFSDIKIEQLFSAVNLGIVSKFVVCNSGRVFCVTIIVDGTINFSIGAGSTTGGGGGGSGGEGFGGGFHET